MPSLPIRFFNTLSARVEEFKPLHAKEVKIYTCGPTVYDYAHIGNFRAFVFEDLLRRFLEASGFQVNHVMNLTDVDDKTIAGAAKEGKPLKDFTATYIKAFQEDLKALNGLAPTQQPLATEEISGPKGMIELIANLVKKDFAYVSDGSVYFRVAKFPLYGKLSKKKLEKNIAGTRVDLDAYEKEEGADFVLWKKAKEGEPSWDSPWGKGRPGWHIECSSMSMKYLGETFDIHAGGEDLIFPHHENEIAQSEAATGKPFVKYWLHCKFLLVNGEKMSKSKGNFYTLRDLLQKGYDPMAIRLALLSVHYRQPLNFTLDGLEETSEIIRKLDECYWQCLSRFVFQDSKVYDDSYDEVTLRQHRDNLLKWLADDLNISAALAEVIAVVSDINIRLSQMNKSAFQRCLHFFKDVDALFGFDITVFSEIPVDIRENIAKLQNFRKEKNFMAADLIRSELNAMGWRVKDGRPGEPSTVKIKRRVWDG